MTHRIPEPVRVAVARAGLGACLILFSSGTIGCQRRSESARGTETNAPAGRAGSPSQAASPPVAGGAIAVEGMVAVAAGTVTTQGRRISVPAFYMDRTEVTAQRYRACVNAGLCTATPTDGDCNAGQPEKRAEYPINCVTQIQATSFCAAHGARLPTAAEWQLAAAGPEERVYPWGAALPSLVAVTEAKNGTYGPGPARHNLCWQGDGTTDETYPKSTCPVASHHAGDTPSGISDLAGNVWEWTSDKRTPPEGAPLYTLKGGGFGYDRMGPLEVRTSDAREYEADFYGPDIGFRCVQEHAIVPK